MATISGEVRDENNDLLADCVVRAYRRDTGALLVAGLSGDDSPEEIGDADFASVVLLLHCDGTDGSTTFTDSSGTPKTVTASGNAHIETSEKQFGTASGQFDGSDDFISIPTSADFGLSGDFTFECWIKPTAWNSGGVIWWGSTTGALQIGRNLAGNLGVCAQAVGWQLTGSLLPTTNIWSHIAAVRSGTTLTLYVNGTSIGSVTNSYNFADSPVYIGSANTNYEFIGYIDEIRLSKGVARYTANFTPPAVAFLGGTIPAKPLGVYSLTTAYTDEVQVIALDPAGGTTFNDLILRTTPV